MKPARRITATVTNFLRKQRVELDTLFPADTPNRLMVVMFFFQQLLGRGQIYQVVNSEHLLIRLDWAGKGYDCDLYADQQGHTDLVRAGAEDEFYDDLIPIATHRLMDADLALMETVAKQSGPDAYGTLVPQLRALRKAVNKQRETLA